jgi:predicted negative regulator of RcsB-dependent stress response
MAVNTFDSHLNEVGTKLQELRNVIGDLEEILKRHGHNNYSALAIGDYAGRQVDKTQYDNALSSITNLVDIWLPGGHGTNIDQYLYEVP